MRILHLNNELSISCGVTRSIINICNYSKNEHKCYIIALKGNAAERLNQNNMDFRFYNSAFPDPIRFLIVIYKIYLFCKKNKIDVIHAHHRYFDLIGFIISKTLKIKTVTSVHSKVYWKRILSYKADKIIAVSEAVKKHLINNFNLPITKISVLNNFIDPNKINISKKKDELLKELKIDSEKKILLFSGRLSREKGLDILLKAFDSIFINNKNIVLLVIGDSELNEGSQKFIEDKKDSVVYIESQKEIFNFINIADLIILPSRTDSFPFAMLEAGFLKKAIIGSRVDGIAEFIENEVDGILFASEDVEELSDKINLLLSRPDKCVKLGENLYRKVNTLSGQKIIRKIIDLYKY
ncbi:MAG: glycosyltransferase family 4 protein [Melioribacteraceae bacterium]|nr:glycosyltransferase family 4 protein [Melioribacteraceae bacterium]